MARALDVPLYRRIITGTAIELGSEYGGRNAKDAGGVAGDETEDLFVLLSSVKVTFHIRCHIRDLRSIVGQSSGRTRCLCWHDSLKLSKSTRRTCVRQLDSSETLFLIPIRNPAAAVCP